MRQISNVTRTFLCPAVTGVHEHSRDSRIGPYSQLKAQLAQLAEVQPTWKREKHIDKEKEPTRMAFISRGSLWLLFIFLFDTSGLNQNTGSSSSGPNHRKGLCRACDCPAKDTTRPMNHSVLFGFRLTAVFSVQRAPPIHTPSNGYRCFILSDPSP